MSYNNKFNIIILEIKRNYIAKGFLKILPNTYIYNNNKIIFERDYYILKENINNIWITISKTYYSKLLYFRSDNYDNIT